MPRSCLSPRMKDSFSSSTYLSIRYVAPFFHHHPPGHVSPGFLSFFSSYHCMDRCTRPSTWRVVHGFRLLELQPASCSVSHMHIQPNMGDSMKSASELLTPKENSRERERKWYSPIIILWCSGCNCSVKAVNFNFTKTHLPSLLLIDSPSSGLITLCSLYRWWRKMKSIDGGHFESLPSLSPDWRRVHFQFV